MIWESPSTAIEGKRYWFVATHTDQTVRCGRYEGGSFWWSEGFFLKEEVKAIMYLPIPQPPNYMDMSLVTSYEKSQEGRNTEG